MKLLVQSDDLLLLEPELLREVSVSYALLRVKLDLLVQQLLFQLERLVFLKLQVARKVAKLVLQGLDQRIVSPLKGIVVHKNSGWRDQLGVVRQCEVSLEN